MLFHSDQSHSQKNEEEAASTARASEVEVRYNTSKKALGVLYLINASFHVSQRRAQLHLSNFLPHSDELTFHHFN